MNNPEREHEDVALLRSVLVVTSFILCITLYSLVNQAQSQGLLAISRTWQAALAVLGTLTLVILVASVTSFTPGSSVILRIRARAHVVFHSLGKTRFLIGGVLVAIPAILLLSVDEQFLIRLPVRILISWFCVLLSVELTTSQEASSRWWLAAAAWMIALGVVYRVGILITGVSDYPFTLGWSEVSRYYYASLYFSKAIYDVAAPPSVLHPSRYLLQSLAFLLPGSTLWVHRLWQVLLWLITTGWTGVALAKRLQLQGRGQKLVLIGFSVLFLFQGPVYYHLLVMVILSLALYRHDASARYTWFIVLAGSIWAGISRLNWFPVPGILVATLYLLESPRNGRSILRYWGRPFSWVAIGTSTAFISQAMYIYLSGSPSDQFGSSFTSSLLWYRLWPNATYDLGILIGMLIVSLPGVVLLWHLRERFGHALGWERTLPLAGITALLLAGGILVSLKIGGGSNLHNLDAYLVVLGIILAYVVYDRIAPENPMMVNKLVIHPIYLLALVSIPLIINLREGQPLKLPDASRVDRTMKAIELELNTAGQPLTDVLFISQRHLITFDMLGGVELIPEHETVFLMEMAMSGNQAYLTEFHRQLKAQTYSLIIVEPLSFRYQERDRAFSEENNAWVQEVSEPISCYYEEVVTFKDTRVQILRPRLTSCHG